MRPMTRNSFALSTRANKIFSELRPANYAQNSARIETKWTYLNENEMPMSGRILLVLSCVSKKKEKQKNNYIYVYVYIYVCIYLYVYARNIIIFLHIYITELRFG